MAPPIYTQDLYEVLEVQANASHDEIKASYRRLAMVHHPDKNQGRSDATVKTQMVIPLLHLAITLWDFTTSLC